MKKDYLNELRKVWSYTTRIEGMYSYTDFVEGLLENYYIVLRNLDDDREFIVDCVPWEERTPIVAEVVARQFDGEDVHGDKVTGNEKMLAYFKSLGMVNTLVIYNDGDPVLSYGLGSNRDNTIANVLTGIEAYYPGTLPDGLYAWYKKLTSDDNSERVHAISELSDIVRKLADNNGPRKPRAWVHHMCDTTGSWFVSDEA